VFSDQKGKLVNITKNTIYMVMDIISINGWDLEIAQGSARILPCA